MNIDSAENNDHDTAASDIQATQQRRGSDRRDVDRRVCDRRLLCGDDTNASEESIKNRRDSDRRDSDRRTAAGARRTNDATPPPLGYELRLEPRGPGGNRKVTEITTTRTLPARKSAADCTAEVDRMARDFHQEVTDHFRQNLPRVQLLRATVECVQPDGGFLAIPASEPIEITLRALCLCRRKPNTGRN